ncbi:hypothetical protein O3Q51_06685 [Cryomorphaceae bacterium 1068]|nr:hypothetical protein [Cryomorphaceae bacterium 1068]
MKITASYNCNVFLLILGLVLSQLCSGQNDTIPFRLTNHNNILVEAIVNTEDSLTLMFHTAGGSVSLTKEGASKLKSIAWTSDQEVYSWGGQSQSRVSENNSFTIGAMVVDSLHLRETTNSGPESDGKVGLDFFFGKAVEINFTKQILVIHPVTPTLPQGYTKIPTDYVDGMIFLTASAVLNHQVYQNQFLIHSGYGGAILFDDGFAKDNDLSSRIEITSEQKLQDSYGNTLLTKKGSLPEFRLGEVSFKNIPVGFFEGSLDQQKVSLMGGDLIKRFDIIIDTDREYLYLKSNEKKDEAYTIFY